eukprot:7387773-Prymnesium_polylepis.2
MGICSSDATQAAGSDALEQPAPIMASTPCSNASRVRERAPASPSVASHLSSRYAMRSRTLGSRLSATPSPLLLISRTAW